MSVVTILWSMGAAACLTLALVHGLVWCGQRDARAHGWFSLFAIGVGMFTLFELWLMRARTPAEYNEAVWWIHFPGFLLIVSLVGFVRTYLRAGRLWLAWTICGLRLIALVMNLFMTPNLSFRAVTALRSIPFLGDTVVLAETVKNPWQLVPHFSLLLLVTFVIDAAVTVWRRGDPRRALTVGGSIVVFTTGGSVQIMLSMWGIVAMPVAVTPFYLGLLLVMSFELSRDLLRAARLSVELRESEQRLALAAEAARLGVWVRDLTGEAIWASQEWRALFGFALPESLDRKKILDRVHPEDRELFLRTLEDAVGGGGRYEMEYRVSLPDGAVRWIGSRGRVEYDDARRPILARGVSLDITERKVAEQEALQRRNEVTHLSRVAMLGELSGSLAHELNQPLTAILSNAQAAQRFLARPDLDRDELGEILSDIVEADKHAGDVIRSLRTLLKKGEVQLSPLDINDAVLEVLKLVRSDLINHRVVVETDLAAGLPPVPGDRVQLQQVILNLILNAADAMTGSGADENRLCVGTARESDDGVRVFVRDHGPGIAEGIRAKIFEPFFTTKPNGLGLGLAVCRSILGAHGGNLSTANHPGGGAVFSFALPRAPAVESSLPGSVARDLAPAA